MEEENILEEIEEINAEETNYLEKRRLEHEKFREQLLKEEENMTLTTFYIEKYKQDIEADVKEIQRIEALS